MEIKKFPCGCRTISDGDFIKHEFCEYHRAIYKGKSVVRK